MLPGTILTLSFTLTRTAYVQDVFEDHSCFTISVHSCYEKKGKKD